MIAYLIKSGLCLAFLLGVYLLFLEREKMHRFNRFFLLFALIFGLTIPFLTIDLGLEKAFTDFQWTELESVPVSAMDAEASAPQTTAQPKEWPIKEAGFIIYGIVLAVLFIRFIRNFTGLIRNIRRSPKAYHHGSKLVLCKENEIPYSFLGYIFLQETRFRNGMIENEIIEHERVHVSQKHSLDILFAELLKIVFWFNPIFYFYKKAIQLNHEFIADEIVTQQTRDISAYQKILLQHSSPHLSLELASSFNYSLTKKRFIMMKKRSNILLIWVKKVAIIPVLVLSVFMFSTEPKAQDNTPIDIPQGGIKYLQIEHHPEKAKTAVFKLFLKTDSKVLFQVYNSEKYFTLVDKALSAGSHNFSFDYSGLEEADFIYTFNVGGKTDVEFKGPLVEAGKLLPTYNNNDNMPPPPPNPPVPVPDIYPKSITDDEKVQIDQAREKYHQAYYEYMNLDPETSSLNELQQAYKAVKVSAENMGLVYEKIAGEDDEITPPLPIRIGPTPEKRKLLNSIEVAKLKAAIDKAVEIRKMASKKYLDMDAKNTPLEELQSAYEEMREEYKKAYEAQVAYYEALGKLPPPPPPTPPNPERRKGID